MDNATNEDASRILKGILNIGEPSRAENGHGSSLPHENDGESDRLKNGLGPENSDCTESIDSYSEQESISLDPVLQSIYLTGDEQQGSISIYGNDVHITTDLVDTRQPIAAGSNRVRINPVTNYDWESKYYNGNLLSVSSKYIAYALRGKSGFMLRILNRKTIQKALIKGFIGSIEDMSFAHYNSDQLACIDSAGDVFIWTISENNDKINYDKKLHIKRQNDKLPEPSAGNRLVWCPYVVDEDENVSERILAVNVGKVAEVFDVDMINQSHGDTVGVDDIQNGIVRVQHGHVEFISDIALAPDGSVLATASEDEKVKFWQLDFQSGDPPRCLHEWIPHEGQPVSRLLFCDNHLCQDDKSPFWRFLITAARHNSELKIWCTVTWSCLQTVKFKPSASSLTLVSPPPLKLKASLDLSARYLVLSDIERKVLYVFLLHQNVEEGKAHVTSVAHFILTQPLLSFVISEAKIFKASVRDSMDQNSDRPGHEEDDVGQEDSEEAKPIPTIRIKLHCINPKAMQEMIVQYYPFASIRPVTPSSVAASSMTNTEPGVQDGLSDVSGLDTSLTELEEVETKSESSPTSRLIAPDAFTTMMPKPFSQPGQDIPVDQPIQPEPEAGSITSSITSVTSLNNSVSIDHFLSKSQMSESEYSFKTCGDATLQEQANGGSDDLNSLLGHTSPPGLPLPLSPDPAKVPFAAFKAEIKGVSQPSEDDSSPSIIHSTPVRRPTPELELDKDIDKTPTGDDEITAKEQHVLSSSPKVLPSTTHENRDDFRPSNEEFEDSQKLAFAGGGSGSKAEIDFRVVGRERLRETDRAKEGGLISLQNSRNGGQDQNDDNMASETQQKLPQRSQRRANLTVTPRKQIDIQPEDTERRQEPSNTSAALDEIRNDVKQLKELLQYQQRDQNMKVIEVLREEVAVLEGAVSSRLENILGQHNAEQDQMFEKFTRDKQAHEKQRHEKMTTSITTAVLNKVEKTVKNEIRNSVGSGFQKLVTPLQDQLNTVMTQKLTAADAVMKESIGKMVQDKSVLDAIGKAICDATQVTFSKTMIDFINNSMLPGFEQACRSMYAQINSAFENGTKQYIQNFETYAENRKDIEKQRKDTIVEQLQALVQNFQAASEKLSTSLSGSLLEMMQTQMTTSMKRLQSSLLSQLQEDLNKSLHETIQNEISTVLMEQRDVNESRSQTQQRNSQLRVEQLIQEQDFNGAFQEALSASDLNLVILVCRSWDPAELFAKDPCPLEQSILLSLIQQLSVDLATDTELKHRYLEEALIALDTDDPVTREHFPAILEGVCEQITITNQFLAQNDPTNPLQRSLKRLKMAAKSLLK